MVHSGEPRRRRKVLFPNPFYVVLLLASTLFVVTALGYLMGPILAQRELDHPEAPPTAAASARAAWFDRWGPTALTVEIGVMVGFGVLAMVADDWFEARAARRASRSKAP